MGTTRISHPPSAGRTQQRGLKLLWLLAWCLGCATTAWSQTTRAVPRALDGSPALQQLLAQTLLPTQLDRFAWPRAAEALGRASEAHDLQLALLDEWVLGLEGQAPPQARSIQAAITHGKGLRADDLQARAQRVWPSVLQSQVQLQWAKDGPSVPLPDEIDALRNDLTPEGPGLWIHRTKDGKPRGLYLWLGVRNSGAEPLPLPQFTLMLGSGAGGALPAAPPLQCAVPRYGPLAVVLPQNTQHYLCRAPEATLASPPQGLGWLALVDRWFAQGTTLRTEIPAQDQALSRTSRLLGQLPNAAVDDFIRTTQPCGARGTCPNGGNSQSATSTPSADRPAKTQAEVRVRTEAAKSKASAHKPSPLMKRLQFALGIVGVLGLYALVAHHAGTTLASVLLWVGLAIPCGLFVRSLWSTSWADSWGGLVVIPATVAALGAPFFGTFLAHGAYRLLVSAQARRNAFIGALTVAGVVVFVLLMNLLEAWLY